MNQWEIVNEEGNSQTQRLKIDGGWIYHVSVNFTMNSLNSYASTFFVPEPDKCSYHQEYLVKACETCLHAKPFIKENT